MSAYAPVDAACTSVRFDEKTGLFSDQCFEQDRERQSRDASMYRTHELRAGPCDEALMRLATCHPNLRFMNGYGGVSACTVDADNQVRITGPDNTNERSRNPLITRVAHAPPSLFRGDLNADGESALIHAEIRDMCAHERESREPEPLIPCIERGVNDVTHVVPTWSAIDSRSRMREAGRKCEFRRRK